jgi:hypothetical protein
MEKKYYPEDGSQFKDFLNKQENGTFVNKTFPGLAVLYAPFFGIGYFVAWVSGSDLDGYAAPFQWAIAFSHLFYFLAGLWLLFKLFDRLSVNHLKSMFVLTALTIGTNCWYYVVYDHSVSHIHSFFLSSLLLFLMERWIATRSINYLGWIGIILSVIVITRPTNAVMLFFLPFLLQLKQKKFSEVLSFKDFFSRRLLPFYLFSFAVLFVPFILWKWQTGNWVVYSYKDEGFDFLHPHFFEFLFSYQKGWLLWSPLVAILLVLALIFHFRKSVKQGLFFLLPIVLAIYILSSWWCWTYGMGFGQRPLIEFLPFIALGFAFAFQQMKNTIVLSIITVPLCFLSIFQGYQVANSILIGGETTSADYWSHFLQWKRDAPKVQLPKGMVKLQTKELALKQTVSKKNPFAQVVEISDTLATHLLVTLKIGGKHGDRDTRIVISDATGGFYKTLFLGDFLYETSREMQFLVDLPIALIWPIKTYVWNGATVTESQVDRFACSLFQKE